MRGVRTLRRAAAFVTHVLNLFAITVVVGVWVARAWGDEGEVQTGVLCNDERVAHHLKERFEHKGAHEMRVMLAVHQGRALPHSGAGYMHLQDSWCEEASVRREGPVVGVLGIEPGMQYFLKGDGGHVRRKTDLSRRAVRRMHFFQLRREDGVQVTLVPARTSAGR